MWKVNVNLQPGQNIPLHKILIRLNLNYSAKPGFKSEIDTCLFLLNAQGKVTGDAGLFFIIT